jgi:para-nitrobenzyl esterase
LAHPELAAQQSGHSGNYALMDIIAALGWLHENATVFGGDPAKVTVMGQSAGAQAINALLHSQFAKRLFRGAILDSGVRANAPLLSDTDREKMGVEWGDSKGAKTPAQLRALPAEALVPVRGQPYRFGPSADDTVVTDTAIDVPVLTGWNGGEGAVGNGQLLTTPVTRAQVEAQAGDAALAALYPSGDDARDASHALGHDAVMVSGAQWAAERLKTVKSPVYYYDFGHVLPDPATAADWGSYHSSELPYIFGTWTRFTKGEQEARIAAMMRAYWVNFIKTGNPNNAGLARWLAFDPAKNDVMALGDTPGMRPIASPEKVALLRSHP